MDYFKNSMDEYEYMHIIKPELKNSWLKAPLTPTKEISDDKFAPIGEMSLDGEWDMMPEAGHNDFSAAYKAVIPGSVHSALIKNHAILDDDGNDISDPYYGFNDKYMREASFRSYRFRKLFTLDKKTSEKRMMLSFGGVCERCEVWLNGKYLGKHTGMFGGPDFDVSGLLKENENELIVLLYGAPNRPRKPYEMPTFFGGGNPWLNLGWLDTVTFNCTYGWHYADIPPLGIWRSVVLKPIYPISAESPAVITENINGDMGLKLSVSSEENCTATMYCKVSPANFSGETIYFEKELNLIKGANDYSFEFKINSPKLWWPNGMGGQNLYKIFCTLVCGGTVMHRSESQFGIRTVQMIPNADENGNRTAEPGHYNWTFVINGKPFFAKGIGWCTTDALMRFDRKSYERFLSAAKMQNVNMVRAWGGGLVETDDFYDICDEYGITVFQEWPTAWDSYMYQPEEAITETIKRNVARLKNRASLVLWCGGNEGCAPFEETELFDPKVLNEMGKLTVELDQTRPWHRQEPAGGSCHNYAASWEGKNPSVNMTLEAPFFGEFGVDCWPNYESVVKYTPKAELDALESLNKSEWHIDNNGVIAHHTPMFNRSGDVYRLQNHVPLFLPPDSLKNSITGSQLAQAVGVRYTLERARTRWPQCSGAILYKLNDPYPTASWSTVDWYGNYKIAAYFVQKAFACVTGIVRLDKIVVSGEPLSAPVYLCRDREDISVTGVRIRVYDGKLNLRREFMFNAPEKYEPVSVIGNITLEEEITGSIPLFIVIDTLDKDSIIVRSWHFLNYEQKCGCLFTLPETKLEYSVKGDVATVANLGDKPAVGVNFTADETVCGFNPDDNYFWLDVGETRQIHAQSFEGIKGASCWNNG